MEKTATLNLRINQDVKHNAETVLSALGLSMTTAITIYLKQIALKGAIPFELSLSKGPNHLNTDLMTADEVRTFLDKGMEDIENGKSMPAKEFFYSKANQTRLKKSIAQLESERNKLANNTLNTNTRKAMDDALAGKNLSRSFDTVDENVE